MGEPLDIRGQPIDTTGMKPTLTEQARTYLQESNATWQEVADSSGVSYHWITDFMSTRGRNRKSHRVENIEAIINYFESVKKNAAA